MAVDTRDKRASAVGVALPVPSVAPNPDGSLATEADRTMLAYAYSGIAAAEAFSGALQIDGTMMPVRVGTAQEDGVPLAPSGRGHAGEHMSARTYQTGRNKARRWGPMEIPALDLATIRAHEDSLKAHGQRTADGYLVGGSPVSVYVTELERVWGDIATEYGLRFVLEEAEP